MEAAFEAQRAGGMAGEGEADVFKRMLVETNPILLIVTFIVRYVVWWLHVFCLF